MPMKQCKLVHIHDGNSSEVCNGDRLFVETYPRVEKMLEEWVNEGWKVKSMIPQYMPGVQGTKGAYSFYLDGMIVYLEKEA